MQRRKRSAPDVALLREKNTASLTVLDSSSGAAPPAGVTGRIPAWFFRVVSSRHPVERLRYQFVNWIGSGHLPHGDKRAEAVHRCSSAHKQRAHCHVELSARPRPHVSDACLHVGPSHRCSKVRARAGRCSGEQRHSGNTDLDARANCEYLFRLGQGDRTCQVAALSGGQMSEHSANAHAQQWRELVLTANKRQRHVRRRPRMVHARTGDQATVRRGRTYRLTGKDLAEHTPGNEHRRHREAVSSIGILRHEKKRQDHLPGTHRRPL